MIREDEVYRIGVLTKTHGINGEMNFSFTDDVFDRVDAEYLICRMDGILVPFYMEEYRFRNDTTALIKFEDIDNEEQARRMAGVEVFFPKALASDPSEGSYTWNYFIGFDVTDEKYGRIGCIESVDDSTVNVLFEIRRDDDNEILLPAHEEFITSINHQERALFVRIPDGLLTLDQTDDDDGE